MIEHINKDDDTLAIIIYNQFNEPGIHFPTPDHFTQQVGYLNHSKGHTIVPHVHNSIERTVHYTNEVLFIKKGRVRVDLYDNDKSYVESRILHSGDVILLSSGGHGFEMLEDTVMIEAKQGPYIDVEKDKMKFEPIDHDSIKLPTHHK